MVELSLRKPKFTSRITMAAPSGCLPQRRFRRTLHTPRPGAPSQGITPFAAIGSSCAAHLSFAGGMQTAAGLSATRCGIRTESRHRRRGGKKISAVKTTSCWTRSLRVVRAWLAPEHWLARCWAAFSALPPSPEVTALIEAVVASRGINLYLRI